jgi:hypothetical protein
MKGPIMKLLQYSARLEIGSNHQRPPANLLNTTGIHYIHSIENWDEIERGLTAIRAKMMLAQSWLLRVSDIGNEMSISNE